MHFTCRGADVAIRPVAKPIAAVLYNEWRNKQPMQRSMASMAAREPGNKELRGICDTGPDCCGTHERCLAGEVFADVESWLVADGGAALEEGL